MEKRVISAIIMVILFIPFLLLGSYFYVVLGSVLGLISLWEIVRNEKEIPNYMKMISYFICLVLILYNYNKVNYYDIVNYPILISMFLVYSVSLIINSNVKKYNYKEGIWLFVMTLLIGIMFNGFIKIRMIGLYELIYCLIIATITDTFALFGGKLFGKNKLCLNISPNKTIEGSIIGTIMGTVFGAVFYYLVIGNINVFVMICITLVLSVLGQIGDLFFSSIKRYYGIKDFSNIIPGHGGILDRLDSLLFVIIGFLLYMFII